MRLFGTDERFEISATFGASDTLAGKSGQSGNQRVRIEPEYSQVTNRFSTIRGGRTGDPSDALSHILPLRVSQDIRDTTAEGRDVPGGNTSG